MATTDNLGDFLTSVANAIRSKSGSTAQINAQDFASEIENLPSGEKTNKFLQLIEGTENVSLTAQDFGDITEIREYAFAYATNLISVVLPNTIISIGSYAFSDCSSLTSVTIPENVTSMGFDTFAYCSSLTSVTLLSTLTSISSSAFKGCSSLSSINIPEGVTSIGSSAFSDCSSLTSVTLPSTLTSIGEYAFKGCSSLSSINIPEDVTIIVSNAFYGCTSLTTMTILATTPPRLTSTSAISTATTKIYIPAGTLEAYQSATNWSNFASLFEELSQ